MFPATASRVSLEKTRRLLQVNRLYQGLAFFSATLNAFGFILLQSPQESIKNTPPVLKPLEHWAKESTWITWKSLCKHRYLRAIKCSRYERQWKAALLACSWMILPSIAKCLFPLSGTSIFPFQGWSPNGISACGLFLIEIKAYAAARDTVDK